MKKLTFPYKIGDTIQITTLDRWNGELCRRKPTHKICNRDMIVTKIGNYKTCPDSAAIADGAPENAIIEYIPFAAICKGKEYGLVYFHGNEFIKI